MKTVTQLPGDVTQLPAAKSDANWLYGKVASMRQTWCRVDGSSHTPRRSIPVDRVINQRLVHTFFQPLVHLADSEVVGFEALSRGPEGTDLENPLALFEAAKEAGRLEELDWLCASSAFVRRIAPSSIRR